MIPQLNQSGLLPPFLPNSGPAVPAATAPYPADLVEIVSRFANTPERKEILRGFLSYRRLLRDAGITDGFQWINGSYVENCEQHRGHPPNDVDVVTFAERPRSCVDDTSWKAFVTQNKASLFDTRSIKSQYRCDAYYVDLALPSRVIVSRTRYWFGLFSHQRTTNLWKGLLEVPLGVNDQDSLDLLNDEGANSAS